MMINPQVILLIIAITIVFTFTLTIISEYHQIHSKVKGGKESTIAKGYNNAMKVLLLNRVGASSYYIVVAFFIDYSFNNTSLLFSQKLLLVSFILTMIFVLGYLILSIKKISSNNLNVFGLKASYFGYTFGHLGLSIPMFLALSFPEYRVTLAYSGFIFNMIFTLTNTLFIEKFLADIIDNHIHLIDNYLKSIYIGRILATTTLIPFYLSIFFFI